MKHISGISILEVDREIPLSEWARQKITSECFTLDSISHSAVFKSFTRSQKDAIRYQLKKLTRNAGSQRALSSQSKNKTSVFLNEKKVKKGEGTFQGGVKQKGRLDRIEFGSVAFSVFFALLVSLFLLEDFVRFYKAEGLTVSRAVFLAVIAELCIFLGALGWSKVLRRLSKFLIGYNAVLFLALCVMDYTHSSSKNLHYLNKVQALERRIQDLGKEKNRVQEQLDKLFQRNIVTSSTRALLPEVEKIDSKIFQATKILGRLQQEHVSENRVSGAVKAFYLFLMFLVRVVLQIFSFELIHISAQKFMCLRAVKRNSFSAKK